MVLPSFPKGASGKWLKYLIGAKKCEKSRLCRKSCFSATKANCNSLPLLTSSKRNTFRRKLPTQGDRCKDKARESHLSQLYEE
ncbi:unnamed protein product [Victoria cruziana]